MFAMMVFVFASCSDGGNENPVNPSPEPEEIKTEITIDSGIVFNGLSFGASESEQSVSFSVNLLSDSAKSSACCSILFTNLSDNLFIPLSILL